MLRPYLQLVRIPAVFSALSNVYAGYWISGGHAAWPNLVFGLIAGGLYLLAGMALNDIADLRVDRAERPERPLPSGAISVDSAWSLVLGLFVLALMFQWLASPASAFVGALLTGAIFLYNFKLKGTTLGPLSMALCRMLNLAGGMALNFPSPRTFLTQSTGVYGALISLGVYIALVTYLARDEVYGNSVKRVRFFLVCLAAWFAAWATVSVTRFSWLSLILFAVVVFHGWLLHDALQSLRRAPTSPPSTGKTVGAMLRTLPATDVLAMLAAGAPILWALAGLAWMLPGRFLARRFYTT